MSGELTPGRRPTHSAVHGAASAPTERFTSFEAFYPFYIREHANRTCRRIHVVGTGLVFTALGLGLFVSPWWLLAMPFLGYGFAWAGHAFFEKNRPATFTYPLWSLRGDFRLFFETVTGRRPF